MIGDDPDAPHMVRAREAHPGPRRGGARPMSSPASCWRSTAPAPGAPMPTMPVELILLPSWFPIHLSKMSYWARTVIVPLLVLQVKKPRGPQSARGAASTSSSAPRPTSSRKRKAPTPEASCGRCSSTPSTSVLQGGRRPVAQGSAPAGDRHAASPSSTERLNGEDGLGAIFPAMANSVMMFDALGYPPDHPRPRHRPRVGGEPAGGQGATRPTASPASRRCGTRPWPPTR